MSHDQGFGAIFATTVQGIAGLGFAMVSVPILALIDPSFAPVPQLLMTLPLTDGDGMARAQSPVSDRRGLDPRWTDCRRCHGS